MDKTTSQFKVGDKVKILPRKGSETDYSPMYVDNMQRYAEQFAIITRVSKSSCKINLDGGVYYWPFEALQLITLKTGQLETDLTIDVSSFRNSIQRINTVTNLPSGTKEEPQIETELNLFPKKKHYQLNFNY